MTVSVSLVCTVHEEKGLANVRNLCAILENIQPEVVFLEMPSAAFCDFIKTCSQRNLESDAARRYRETRQVELIPVDLPTPGGDFFGATQYMFEQMERSSREYCSLMDSHSAYVSAYGFDYLNSEYCSNLWADVNKEMRDTIGRLASVRLTGTYELWNKTHELREDGMLKTISDYCRRNTFDRGVFLVGAAHRQSIIDKSRDQSAMGFSLLW